ncbi:MAG: hypothetical protein HZC28_04795 [Spirochaetes bacterium]|nr:hypothetical protein [Spirochaetota bacterium]
MAEENTTVTEVRRKVSKEENGDRKNLASAVELIAAATTMGAKYRPATADLALANIKKVNCAAVAAMDEVRRLEPTHKTAQNERRSAYKELKHIASRVLKTMKSCGAAKKELNDVSALQGRVMGYVQKKKDGGRSTAQTGFANRIGYFRDLAAMLAASKVYATNENDLTVAALKKRADNLAALNEATTVAAYPLHAARLHRDTVLYAQPSGLVDIGIRSKRYIEGAFGANSAEYKMIRAIVFKRRDIVSESGLQDEIEAPAAAPEAKG